MTSSEQWSKKVKWSHNDQVNLKLFGHYSNKSIPLVRKNYVKYLGVLIDNNWLNNHINEKIGKTVGIIARLGHFVPLNILQTIYKTLLSSSFSYGTVAWEQEANTHANKPFLLQKRALRLCTSAIIQLTRFHIFVLWYSTSKHALFQISCYSHARYQIQFSTTKYFTLIQHYWSCKYTLITLDPRQEVITKLNF